MTTGICIKCECPIEDDLCCPLCGKYYGSMPKLHIGCGHDHKIGFVNIDKAKEVKPDMVVNIERKLPFSDNTFTYIYSKHCIEHIRPQYWKGFLNELSRIAKPNCILELDLPFDSIRTRGNIDHYRTFNYGSFDQLRADNRDYSGLRLENIDPAPTWKKIFYYLFPILKYNIHYEFLIKKK